jgi:hypothetical protein
VAAARFANVPQANIHDRRSIERVYPADAFAVDAAQNQKQPANELIRGVRIAAPPDGNGVFELAPAARHIGEDSGREFLAPYRPVGAEAHASADPDRGYASFIDDIIAAARELAETTRPSPGTSDPRLQGARQ